MYYVCKEQGHGAVKTSKTSFFFFSIYAPTFVRSFVCLFMPYRIRLKKSNILCIDRIAETPWTGTDTCAVVSHVDNRAYSCFPGHWIHMHMHCPQYLRVALVIWAIMNGRTRYYTRAYKAPFSVFKHPMTLTAKLHQGPTWIVQWLFYTNHHSCNLSCDGGNESNWVLTAVRMPILEGSGSGKKQSPILIFPLAQ